KLFLDTGEILTAAEDGSFRINALPLRPHSVVVIAPGRMRRHIWFDTAQRPQAELELRLSRGQELKGKVIDEVGQPVRGAWLDFMVSGNALSQQGCQHRCEPDGTFVLDCVPPNSRIFHLTAFAPGFSAESRLVQLRPGVSTPLVTFVLHRDTRN